MYQQGLVEHDDQRSNFYNNQEFMPNPPTDAKDVIAFRRWNAESWVRPMYFLTLVLTAIVLIVDFIGIVDSGSGGIIFFGIVLILICCGACLIFHRILYEVIMALLQLPKLISAMERLAQTVQQTNNLDDAQRKTTHDGPSIPVMTSTSAYQNEHHKE
mmetsp:Transcript_59722/g.94998  ORF Transcript_59722/g.94998 Transcript_59722/m.94998 type:complete len:158 (-) Transcript_59722:20-493(-)